MNRPPRHRSRRCRSHRAKITRRRFARIWDAWQRMGRQHRQAILEATSPAVTVSLVGPEETKRPFVIMSGSRT